MSFQESPSRHGELAIEGRRWVPKIIPKFLTLLTGCIASTGRILKRYRHVSTLSIMYNYEIYLMFYVVGRDWESLKSHFEMKNAQNKYLKSGTISRPETVSIGNLSPSSLSVIGGWKINWKILAIPWLFGRDLLEDFWKRKKEWHELGTMGIWWSEGFLPFHFHAHYADKSYMSPVSARPKRQRR